MSRTVTENALPLNPLNAGQVALLRRSFGQIEPQGTIAALIFYKTLFSLDPSLKGLFHTSIELQARKLMDSLAHTVATLEAPEKLVPMLEAMGRRHVTYGVRDEHYDTVISALMSMLRETLGNSFTPEANEAWLKALNFVSDVMKHGAAGVQELANPPDS